MAGLAVAAAVVCLTLPETHNQPTKENLFQEEACQPKNEKLGDEELAAKVWWKTQENEPELFGHQLSAS